MAVLLTAWPLAAFAQPAPRAPSSPVATAPAQTAPAAPAPPAWRISGYVFGDYYYFASDHDPRFEDQNGFWIRRAYFTYDHTLPRGFSSRLRLEMNSAGDLTNTRLTPFVKDAYVRWARGPHAVLLGMSGTPTFEFIESVWGYRFIEKTPLDLQRWDGSRDLGIAAQGSLGPGRAVNYHVMFGNGSDTGSETNRNKSVRGALSYRRASGLAVEGYADWQDQPNGADRSTLQAFGAYRKPAGRIGVHYARQVRRSAVAPAADFNLLSVFAVARVNDRHFALARVDRMFEPNPDGARIPYVPFNPRARALLGIVGWDIVLQSSVHVSPNVEFVRYGRIAGTRVRSDVIPRVTFYFVWP